MFKVLYNQGRLELKVVPVTPILIKSGRDSFDPTRPDMEFIRVRTGFGEVPYLPGSSLRGVIRSHAERVLRSLGLPACDVTVTNQACGTIRHSYAEQCFACRTFGSTRLAGRLRLADALPWRPAAGEAERKEAAGKVVLERRTSNRIDRRKGTAAQGAVFESEVVTDGAFYAEVTIRNYQLWQLALLALVLRDVDDGFQRIGAGKSRGLGRVRVEVVDWQLESWGVLARSPNLQGVGAVPGLGEYDLIASDELAVPQEVRAARDEWDRFVEFGPGAGSGSQQSWESLGRALVRGPWQRLLARGGAS